MCTINKNRTTEAGNHRRMNNIVPPPLVRLPVCESALVSLSTAWCCHRDALRVAPPSLANSLAPPWWLISAGGCSGFSSSRVVEAEAGLMHPCCRQASCCAVGPDLLSAAGSPPSATTAGSHSNNGNLSGMFKLASAMSLLWSLFFCCDV